MMINENKTTKEIVITSRRVDSFSWESTDDTIDTIGEKDVGVTCW